MKCTVVWAVFLAAFASGTLRAQSPPQPQISVGPPCMPTRTLDKLVAALDGAVSGPANRDRSCLRQIMLPEARLSPIAKAADGSFAPHLLTVDGWIEAVARRGSEPIYERQVKVSKQQYGHIAHLWCNYEIRPTPDGKATLHGVNSIQAVHDGTRWRVIAILWEAETTAGPDPETKTP